MTFEESVEGSTSTNQLNMSLDISGPLGVSLSDTPGEGTLLFETRMA